MLIMFLVVLGVSFRAAGQAPPLPKPGTFGSPKAGDGKGSLQQPTPPNPPPPLEKPAGQ